MNRKNLRRQQIVVTAQTLYHLKTMAGSNQARAMGQIVDHLMRKEKKGGRTGAKRKRG